MCMIVLPASVYMHHMSTWRPEEDARSPGTRVPGGCWEMNVGPPEEQPVFLSAFLQPSTFSNRYQ